MALSARTSLAALLLTAASLTACGGGEADTTSASGGGEVPEGCEALREEHPELVGKKYNVGSAPGAGNYNNPNLENPKEVKGLEPDILRAAGRCLGFEVTYMPQSFDGLIPSIKSGRIDLISSGMYATEERAQEVSFVTHLTAATAAVIADGNPEGIESLDDTCGRKVAAVTGTVENEITAEQNAKCEADGKKPAKIDTYAGNDQAVNAVRQGRSDYFLTDAGVAAQVAQQFDDDLDAGFAVPSDFAFGFGVDKNNTALIEGLHAALMKAYEDGSLEAAQQEWGFAEEQALEPAIVTA